jgi:hypothetical protein
LSALTPSMCIGYYEALRSRTTKYGKALATDSHRNILAEAKTFLKWSVGKGYLPWASLGEGPGYQNALSRPIMRRD